MTGIPSTRLWLGLGAFALVHSADALAQPAAPAAAPTSLGGGEGGEGGEGGVDLAQAATDPVVFLTALEIIAAHVLAARDAHAAGEARAAAEMFAHPISEIYVEIEPVFAERGVAPFQDRLERASALALDGAPTATVAAAAAGLLGVLDVAATRAPGVGATLAVRARVLGELLDRAALQYLAAAKAPGELEPHLDGYGFAAAARRQAVTVLPALDAAGQGAAATAARAALAALDRAYPAVLRQATTSVEPGTVLAAAGRARLLLDTP